MKRQEVEESLSNQKVGRLLVRFPTPPYQVGVSLLEKDTEPLTAPDVKNANSL